MANGTHKPVRFIKEGKTKNSAWAHYSYKVSCGRMKVTIITQNDFPIRCKVEPVEYAGCEANLEAVSRLVTLLLECNVGVHFITKQLKKVECKSCQRAMGKAKVAKGKKGVNELSKSCAYALGKILDKVMREEAK